MYKKRQRRKYIMIGLCMVMLMMAVGYAAFYSQLKISGTSTVTSNWDVEITSITKSQVNGNIEEKVEPSFTKDSATFSVGLEKPGDYIYYKIGVTNKGSIAAIATLGNLTCTKSNAISCGAYADSNISDIGSNTDLTSRRLIIDSNETEYYNVWVKYNPDITNQPDVTNVELKLELTYKQSDVGITHKTEDNCYTGKVLENGTLEITDYDETCGSEVVIPEEIDGYTVTRIANGKWDSNIGFISPFYSKGITSVAMPNTITYIGDNAFVDNKISNVTFSSQLKIIGTEAFAVNKLTEINLPDNLNKIGDAAFRNNNLTKITIPNSVTYLGDGAFAKNNVAKENAIIYGRNSDGATDYNTLNSYAGADASGTTIPNVKTIASGAYRQVKFDSVILPETVENIELLAFSGSLINELVFNNNLKVIERQAFESNNLSGILTIPNSVINIGQYAFRNNNLEIINIGKNIKTIASNSFGNNDTLKTININRLKNTVQNAPWGATKAQINWTGSN